MFFVNPPQQGGQYDRCRMSQDVNRVGFDGKAGRLDGWRPAIVHWADLPDRR